MTDQPQKLPTPFTDKLKGMSWKTTASGLLGGIGLAMTLVPATAPYGVAIAAIGHVLQGIVSRDNDKTSEQVGAGNIQTPSN